MPALLKKRIRTFSRGATPPTRSTIATIAISSDVHDDIEMLESFIAMLPKSGQTSGELGVLHHANKFSMEFLLGMLDLSSEYDVSAMANRVDVAICVR